MFVYMIAIVADDDDDYAMKHKTGSIMNNNIN